MPPTYTRSVKRYEELMRELRAGGPVEYVQGSTYTRRSLWWHVKGYYQDAQPVLKKAFQVLSKSGERSPYTRNGWPAKPPRGARVVRNADGSPALAVVLCFSRKPGAKHQTAQAGLYWMADRFGFEPIDPYAEANARDRKAA
jgi:hypothetical protein